MISGISSSYNNPRYNPWVERNKINDLSNLSLEETLVIEDVKKLISQLGDSRIKVQITDGELQHNGMKFSVTGFMSTGIEGTGDFSLDKVTLKKMATDESFKQDMMSTIQGFINEEKKNQIEFAKIKEFQSKSKHPQFFYMDFWNDKKEQAKSINNNFKSTCLEAVVGKYEQQFNYVN